MSPLDRSFHRALARLKEAIGARKTSLNRDAAIQRFEFCFELSWKSIQKAARAEGMDCASPKTCLRFAFRRGWIEDERRWLEAGADRNLTSHTYDEKLARAVYGRLHRYVPLFDHLAKSLKTAG